MPDPQNPAAALPPHLQRTTNCYRLDEDQFLTQLTVQLLCAARAHPASDGVLSDEDAAQALRLARIVCDLSRRREEQIQTALAPPSPE